jgi:FkbM family methyltransferase
MFRRILKNIPPVIKRKPSEFLRKLSDEFATKSYSQEGEDMILKRLFKGQKKGFYVDIGAHHPRRFSNTFFFYKNGWNGINIEPNPDAFRIFETDRRRDINLQVGISDKVDKLTYYMFDESALNSFDKNIVNSRLSTTNYILLKEIEVTVERLDSILKKFLPIGQVIDFLSIDVEGFDLAVLKSNDWSLYRPKYVLAEALGLSMTGITHSDIYTYMESHSYELIAKTYNTLVFSENKA